MNINYTYNADTALLLKELIDTIDKDVKDESYKNVLIVTPNNIKDDIEFFIKKEEIVDPHLKIKISTISDIVTKVNKHKSRNTKKLNNLQEKIIIQSILNQDVDLDAYESVRREKGFIDIIQSTLNSIDSYMVSEKLRKIEEHVTNPILKSKIKDLNYITRERDARLSPTTKTAKDFYIDASNLIAGDYEYSTSSVIFVMFEELTPIELTIVRSIIKTSFKSTFILKTDSIKRDPSIDSLQFFKLDCLIKSVNENIDIDTIANSMTERDVENNELAHISSYLYKYPFESIQDKTDFVFINNYKTIQDELLNIAINIDKDLKTLKNINYRDITIAVPNLSQKKYVISDVLKEFGIPFNIECGEYNSSNLFIKDLELVHDIIVSNFNSDTIINYLRCGTIEFNKEDVFDIESFISKNLLRSIDFEKEEWIDSIDTTEDDDLNTYLKDKADRIIKPVNTLIKQILDSNDNVNICLCIYNFLQEIKFNIERSVKLNGNDIITWNAIIKTLKNLSKADYIQEITQVQLLDIIISESKKYIKNNSTQKSNSISVMDINNINKINPKIMYAIDLNEGILPSGLNTTTLFRYEDLKELRTLGVNLELTPTESILYERFKVYDVLSKPSTKLYLSYLELDKDGKVISPSQTIERIKQLFPGYSKIDTLEEQLISEGTSDINIPIHTAAIRIASEIHNSEDNKVEENIKNIDILDHAFGIIKASLAYSNDTTFVNKNKLNNLYFSDTLSVSKLERYAKCPFAYFLETGLKLKLPEINRPDARHRGIFIHTILENFGKHLQYNKINWCDVDNEYIESSVRKLSSDLIIKNQFKVFTLSKENLAYIKTMEDIAIISLKAIKEHLANSFFESLGHEITFGEKSTYPPIFMKLESGKRIKIRGQIDRADVYKRRDVNYIRVVDYKTGDTAVNFSDIVYGLQLQLFVYLNALLENYKTEEVSPAGLFYLNLHNPIIKTNPTMEDNDIEEYRIKELKMKGIFCNESEIPQSMDKGIYDQEYTSSKYIQAKFKNDGTLSKVTPGLTTEDITALYSYTKERAIEIATQMISGDISIKPIKKTNYHHCDFCRYHSICMFDESTGIDSINFLPEIQKGDALNIIREKVLVTNE